MLFSVINVFNPALILYSKYVAYQIHCGGIYVLLTFAVIYWVANSTHVGMVFCLSCLAFQKQ